MEQPKLTKFKEETNSIFDLKHLETKRTPFDLGEFKFDSFTEKRVNHYLIKSNNDGGYTYGEIDSEELRRFIKLIESQASEMGFNLKNRYCFVTIDQGWVEPGHTLRDEGWHLDGLQGDEVPIKKPTDLQFIWSDGLPTIFSSQNLDAKGLDPSTHNVFKWIDKQVSPESIIKTNPYHIYAMNTYHIHKATEATEKTFRRFIRVSYTYIPVTSKRMTVNADMDYNYEYHKTTGEIPSYLQ